MDKGNRARGTRLLQILVRENSTRGNESSTQAIIIEKCRQLGLTLDIWEIGGDELKSHPPIVVIVKASAGILTS